MAARKYALKEMTFVEFRERLAVMLPSVKGTALGMPTLGPAGISFEATPIHRCGSGDVPNGPRA